MRFLAILAPVALLGLAACDDGAAEKAAADARAKAQADAAARKLDQAVQSNVRCHAAIMWQRVPLQRGGIGDPGIYLSYYRDLVAKTLGDKVIPAAPPAPELSAANLESYLDWADRDQAAKFAADKRSGHATLVACVQRAAELGTGPMAKLNPAERFDKMNYLREHLRLRGI